MTTHRREPRSRPAAASTAVLLGLATLAVGVLVVVDAVLPAAGPHSSVLRRAIAALDGQAASTASTALGVGVAVLGIALVALALAPRRRTHVPLSAQADAWITPRAVAALAVRSAERQPDVLAARIERIGRRRVVIGLTPRADDRDLTAAREAILAELEPLDRVTVDLRIRAEPS